jgi:hypothetical protein
MFGTRQVASVLNLMGHALTTSRAQSKPEVGSHDSASVDTIAEASLLQGLEQGNLRAVAKEACTNIEYSIREKIGGSRVDANPIFKTHCAKIDGVWRALIREGDSLVPGPTLQQLYKGMDPELIQQKFASLERTLLSNEPTAVVNPADTFSSNRTYIEVASCKVVAGMRVVEIDNHEVEVVGNPVHAKRQTDALVVRLFGPEALDPLSPTGYSIGVGKSRSSLELTALNTQITEFLSELDPKVGEQYRARAKSICADPEKHQRELEREIERATDRLMEKLSKANNPRELVDTLTQEIVARLKENDIVYTVAPTKPIQIELATKLQFERLEAPGDPTLRRDVSDLGRLVPELFTHARQAFEPLRLTPSNESIRSGIGLDSFSSVNNHRSANHDQTRRSDLANSPDHRITRSYENLPLNKLDRARQEPLLSLPRLENDVRGLPKGPSTHSAREQALIGLSAAKGHSALHSERTSGPRVVFEAARPPSVNMHLGSAPAKFRGKEASMSSPQARLTTSPERPKTMLLNRSSAAHTNSASANNANHQLRTHSSHRLSRSETPGANRTAWLQVPVRKLATLSSQLQLLTRRALNARLADSAPSNLALTRSALRQVGTTLVSHGQDRSGIATRTLLRIYSKVESSRYMGGRLLGAARNTLSKVTTQRLLMNARAAAIASKSFSGARLGTLVTKNVAAFTRMLKRTDNLTFVLRQRSIALGVSILRRLRALDRLGILQHVGPKTISAQAAARAINRNYRTDASRSQRIRSMDSLRFFGRLRRSATELSAILSSINRRGEARASGGRTILASTKSRMTLNRRIAQVEQGINKRLALASGARRQELLKFKLVLLELQLRVPKVSQREAVQVQELLRHLLDSLAGRSQRKANRNTPTQPRSLVRSAAAHSDEPMEATVIESILSSRVGGSEQETFEHVLGRLSTPELAARAQRKEATSKSPVPKPSSASIILSDADGPAYELDIVRVRLDSAKPPSDKASAAAA